MTLFFSDLSIPESVPTNEISFRDSESFEDCARREAKEEAGVEIESMSYVALDKYIDKTTGKLLDLRYHSWNSGVTVEKLVHDGK